MRQEDIAKSLTDQINGRGIYIGTYIRLSILPSNISNREWENVYEESLELVKAFPFADIDIKEYFGFRIPVYTKAIEKVEPEKHWSVVGDLESKQYAEAFKLYKDLNKYQNFSIPNEQKDILFVDDKQKEIFDSKTQGHPYHLHVLAIAMLIESRFPKSAIVGGDIDLKQCIKAKKWADSYLSLPVEIPVRVQPKKLLSRFSNLKNELEQIHILEKWLIADSENIFKMIYTNFSRETLKIWLSNKLQSFSSPNQVGALKWMVYYLNVTSDVDNLVYIACEDENGPKFPPLEFIKALARTWICLPREKFSYLKLFNKIAGHPQIVERQFGMVILDMKFTGREIKTFIPLKKVVKCLVHHFPELNSQIESTLRHELSKIENELSVFHNQIQSTIELSNSSIGDRRYLPDEDAFLYFNKDTVILTQEQELLLKGIAYSIKIILKNEGSRILKKFFYGNIENLKRILAGLLIEKYNTILTEQAWEWINKTEDPRLVRVLVAKLIIDDANDVKHHKAQADLRKAMFENKALTVKIANYMDDEVAMKQIETYIK